MKHSEAFVELTSMAENSFGAIDAELLAAQVMRVTDAGDWPLQRAGMEALRRRWTFAKRDGLRIASRPKGGPFGCYGTRRKGASERPYATQLFGLSPLRASCDCPDFRQCGLGACKHVLVVLSDLHAKPRRLRQALEQSIPPNSSRVLMWDPVRPLVGPGDWLDRVYLQLPEKRNGKRPRLARWFEDGGSPLQALKNAHAGDQAKRGLLVNDLLAFVRAGGTQRKLASCKVDAALVPLLDQERARLEAGAGLTSRALAGALHKLKQPLYAYQRQGVEKFLREGHLLLADDMGLGKTAQAIAACHVLYRLHRVQRGLLIVPASLKPQWQREWQRFTDVPVQIVDGSPDQRQQIYEGVRQGFLIINYEQLLRDLPRVRHFEPGMVVLDEAQRIKNWATKTALFVKQLEPRYRLVLTGTPMENRLDELASIMQWIDRGALEPAWRLAPWHQTARGARHLETLRQRLQPRMLRRVRQDVLDQLPARTDTRVPVELTEEQALAHADYDQPIARLIRTSHRRPLTQAEFLRLMTLLAQQRIICNGLALAQFDEVYSRIETGEKPTPSVLRGLFSPKLEELRQLLQTLVVEQGRRVVVFSQWRRMLQLASWAADDLLAAAGLRAVFFTGRETQKRRTHNVIDFHDDEATRVLFATDAGGVGLNLQRAASCCINLELPWNPAVLEQRIGRIYRLGQPVPVEVYNLVSEGGIESRIASLVGNKQALFAGLFDGTSDEVLFEEEGAFMDRIEQLVEPAVPEVPSEEDDERELDLDDHEAPRDDHETPRSEGEPRAAARASHAGPSATERAMAAGPSAASVQPLAAQDLSSLTSQLDIQLQPDGSVHFKVPPAGAAVLANLLQRVATQLRDAAE